MVESECGEVLPGDDDNHGDNSDDKDDDKEVWLVLSEHLMHQLRLQLGGLLGKLR